MGRIKFLCINLLNVNAVALLCVTAVYSGIVLGHGMSLVRLLCEDGIRLVRRCFTTDRIVNTFIVHYNIEYIDA